MTTHWRSYLFVPGNRPERFAKACASGAHAVIVDLEDAVPPAQKAAARAAIAEWLSPEQPVLVRINAADTEWFADDARMCRHPGVAGIVLPKTETAEHLAAVAARAGTKIPVLPLIETAAGLWNALAIAKSPAVRRLIFGSIDFQVDVGIRGDDQLDFHRAQLVLASRVGGIGAPVDGVSETIDDVETLGRDVARARRQGFGGKLCIHPKQVAAVNEGFRPTAAEVEWAKRVIAADAQAKGAAVAVDGRMVDRPVMLKARAILAEAGG